MDRQTRTCSRIIERKSPHQFHLMHRLLTIELLLGLVFVAIIGVLRLFQSFDGGTISTWRLVLLFANAFGFVAIVYALHARGRGPRRPRNVGRRRS